MTIVYSPKCLEYQEPGHPESPSRVGDSCQFLIDKNFEFTPHLENYQQSIAAKPNTFDKQQFGRIIHSKQGAGFIEPLLLSEKDLLLVHSQQLIEEIKNEQIKDLDTPNLKGIFNYALLSVSGAVTAMEIALSGETSFSLMRPPGHHAGHDSGGGFCYFNNIAVAVAKAIKKARPVRSRLGGTNGVKKVAILDIDCHHGSGTEDIFLGKNNVLYASLHQSPLYPGTGLWSQFNCLNFPLSAETSEIEYLEILKVALEKISDFSPNLLGISVGFDTYKKDPLTSFNLEIESYKKIGEKIADLKVPTFAVLEGGYSSDLPVCLYNFLLGLNKYDKKSI